MELKKWDKPEYAKYIAPRLYALEKAETPPKLFSYVLHCWNLPPAAPLEERFQMNRQGVSAACNL